YLTSKPRWQKFSTPAEAAATGHEQHSQRADPQFRNAPLFQTPIRWDDANTRNFLKLRVNATSPGVFETGDHIEINGDGVLRIVTAATADSVQFDPPLPALPFRDALIWNWKKAASTVLDLRAKENSPALTAGQDKKAAGANLDVPAFQRGDFNGSGKRDIPDLPEDLKAALPDPNAIVIPVHGE
ncbi:MAG: hypothetical protein NTX50_18935, partial [Candidatus Sumerlaeota bacterium]|nr:hypothetical protein [Candidatus Sumerlaeota bacterium]